MQKLQIYKNQIISTISVNRVGFSIPCMTVLGKVSRFPFGHFTDVHRSVLLKQFGLHEKHDPYCSVAVFVISAGITFRNRCRVCGVPLNWKNLLSTQ
jgi:hypothetical protein